MMESILVEVTLLLFPLLIYLIYAMNNENFNQDNNILYFDFALLSSFYLSLHNTCSIGLSIIPLLLAYLKKRTLTAFFIGILLIYDSIFLFTIGIILSFIIYILYYKSLTSKIFLYLSILAVCLIDVEKSLFTYLTNIFLFIATFYLVVYSYLKIESIMTLHFNVKEIIKATKYKETLFKITHEIKNPIAVCKSYLDMFDINNKEHEKYIEILKDEMDVILILLQDFSSMNNIKLNKDIMDITLLVKDVIKQFGPFLNHKCLKYKCSLLDDDVYIEGDYNRLNQVLINVLKNAIESREKNLKINIETKCSKKYFEIIISDNGMGFNMKEFNKIKEPFYTTKLNGTGLGVSLIHEIIEAHNGRVIYNSVQKKGTTVTLKLPMIHL